MKSRKSQIKMFETIGILIVFFFLIGFGLIFYTQMQGSGLNKLFQEEHELKSINVAQLTNYLPEIQCSSENILTENCFDIVKVESFSEVTPDNRLYYYNLFYSSNITVEQVYPEPTQNWNIYSSVPVDWRDKTVTHLPILLYDPIDKRYNTGVVHIEVFR